MNPFGIGPFGACFLTVFITLAVGCCVWMMTEATCKVTNRICETVEDMWATIENIADTIWNQKPKS